MWPQHNHKLHMWLCRSLCKMNGDICKEFFLIAKNYFLLCATAAEARRASFTPIIASCEAIFDCEAEVYFKRLATILSKKWDSSYSHALSYIRARMQICIMRSVSLCMRGCRTKWRGAGIVDYAAIPLNVFNSDE